MSRFLVLPEVQAREMDVGSWFFESWSSVLKTVTVGLSCYVSLIVLLRASGKRTLSKMNMFDWVVTVAMGSVMASALVSDGVSYAQAVAAFVTLIGAQWVVTTLSYRSATFENIVKAAPTILYYHGTYFEREMRRERVPKSEILGAIRQNAQGAPDQVAAVLLESNGELTVMNKVDADQRPTLTKAGNFDRVGGVG